MLPDPPEQNSRRGTYVLKPLTVSADPARMIAFALDGQRRDLSTGRRHVEIGVRSGGESEHEPDQFVTAALTASAS